MAEEINDGGPAFPFGTARFDGGNHYLGKSFDKGMSLRDWFAGQALPTIMERYLDNAVDASPFVAAYEVADAMIKAREAKP